MSSVDERVVRMRFENDQFKRAAGDTKKSLSDIASAVADAGKGKGLLDMANHMETVRVKASAMQVATVTAIANIANRAVDAGINMAKSLTLDPVKAGFDEYELKMKSIQTILANTKGENLKSVSKALNELNEYSDKTIYNFANMTSNIGKLTTSGLGLKDATATVKGFHNMVALAGGDAMAAAGAMEQFGQGLQAGVIKAIDWQSISTRGLGSQSLQKAFFETARAAGTLKDVPLSTSFEEWTKSQGGFKASLEKGWLTSDVATKALGIMTGDVKNVQKLMKMGFDKKTAKDMLEIAENAEESATKVRTFTAFMDTLKEQLGSGWSQLIETVVGDFDEATALFTGLSDISGKALGAVFGWLGKLLKGWDEMGGRVAILQTIKNILAPFGAILSVIAEAWGKAFPAKEAGGGLAAISKALEFITRPLVWLAEIISGAVGPLTAFFRLFSIGAAALKEAGGYIADFVGRLIGLATGKLGDLGNSSAGGLVKYAKEVAEAIGDAIEKIDKLLDKGASLKEAFGSVDLKLPDMPKMPNLKGVKSAVNMDSMPALAAMSGPLKGLTGNLLAFNREDQKAGKGTIMDGSAMRARGNELKGFGESVGGAFSWIGEKLGALLEGFSIEDLMAAFNLAVLSTFMISVSRFMNTATKAFEGFVGTGAAFNDILTHAGGALKSLQTQAQAKLILNIAIALGILAVSLWLLSKIPADKLLKAILAMAGIGSILKNALKNITEAVEKLDGKGINAKILTLSVALIALGVSMLLLAIAMRILDKVGWDDLLKGLVMLTAIIVVFDKLGKMAEKSEDRIKQGAKSIFLISLSMIMLAGALLLFKLVDWTSMLKAGVSLAGLAVALVLLGGVPAPALKAAGGALFAISAGIMILAIALAIFGLVKWESIGKAAVTLGLLTLALIAIGLVGNPVTISGVVGLAAAVLLLSAAMVILNYVDWSSIGKLALVLGVLVIALAAFLALMYLAAPVIPILGLFALALLAIGAAFAFFAAGLAIAMGLAAAGTAAFAALATGAAVAIGVFLTSLALQAPIMKNSILTILQAIIDTFVEATPMIIQGIKDIWAEIKKEFGSKENEKDAKDAGGKMVKDAAQGAEDKIPVIVAKASKMIIKFLNEIEKESDTIASAGMDVIVAFIRGIGARVDELVYAAGTVVVKFIEGVGKQKQRIVSAAFQMIIDFVNGLADEIRRRGPEIGVAAENLGAAIVTGTIRGITSGASAAINRIGTFAQSLIDEAKGVLGIFSPSRVFRRIGQFLTDGLTLGVQDHAAAAISAVASMVGGQIAVANEYISKYINDLDQKALAASAKAEGLRRAAEKAAKAAEKTKNKKDDKSADRLGNKAEKAEKAAEKAESKAEKAKEAQDRREEYQKATLLEKAQMRSEDAQTNIEAAKSAEFRAAAALTEAKALEKQAQAAGVSKEQRKKLLAEAKRLRDVAKTQALLANTNIEKARKAAAEALVLQKASGAEAAKSYDQQFKTEAEKAEELERFNEMTDAEKAEERRKQAAALKSKADADLARAKKLAYTDLEGANALAQEAMAQAEQARAYLKEAEDLEKSQTISGGVSGEVVSLAVSDATAAAFNEYERLYDQGTAAAAADSSVEFNQYNYSPEALSPTEIYRQSNNLFTKAVDKIAEAA